MQHGKRDRRITLEAPTVGQGASGGMKRQWVLVTECWASVRNLPGTEKDATGVGGGQVAEARTEFGLLYRPGVTAKMRIRYDGRTYNIRHVNDWQEKHQQLVLTCDTGASDG